MAYGDFTTTELIKKFGVKFRAENLFAHAVPLQPSAWLMESLERGQNVGFGTEKSRSERLVTPILLEINTIHHNNFSIYSGVNLDVDERSGLKGECDFIFSFSRIQDFVTAPVFCITEAKKQDLEQGTVQVSAQLIGAKKFNEMENTEMPILYGASTTGVEWRFLKYENNEIVIDEKRYLITQIAQLLGVFEAILQQTTPK